MNNVENAAKTAMGGKRDLILNTALDLFLENGYLDTKIIDIANAAGIGKGTIYEYFSSKEELFTELIQLHVVERYSRMEEDILSDDISCSEQLRRYILFDMETAQRFGKGKNFIDQLSWEPSLYLNPGLKDTFNQLMRFRLDLLSSIISKGIARGEFTPIEPMTATLSMMGAIAAFISFRYGFVSELGRPSSGCPGMEGSLAGADALLGLLLHGLASGHTGSD